LKPRETIELAKRDGRGPLLSRITGGDCVEIVQAFRRYWAREGAKSGREFAVLVIARISRCDSLAKNERSGEFYRLWCVTPSWRFACRALNCGAIR